MGTYTTRNGTLNLRPANGPRGPQGPEGEPGQDGAPGGSDAETAQRIQSGPQTQSALGAELARSGSPAQSAVANVAGAAATAAISPALTSDAARASLLSFRRRRAQYLADQARLVEVTLGTLVSSSAASALEINLGAVTLTNSGSTASTSAPHGLAVGDYVRFGERSGASGINGVPYYVSAVPSATTFQVYANNNPSGGTAGFGSDGTATLYRPPFVERSYVRDESFSPYRLALTIAAASDLFSTPTPHLLRAGDVITVASSNAGGVSNNVRLYVRTVPTATTFTVSASKNGATLDVTSDGTAYLQRPNPRSVFVDARPVQKNAVSPAHDYVIADLVTTVAAGGTSPLPDLTQHTMFDGAAIEYLPVNDGASFTVISVDGVVIDTITSAQLSAVGVSSGNGTGRRLYTFPDARPRLLTVRTNGALGAWARPIRTPIYRPSARTLPHVEKWLAVGDSFTEGQWPQVMKATLGQNNLVKAGSGGTGWLDNGGEEVKRVALKDRYQTDVIAENPLIVQYALGLNDRDEYVADPAAFRLAVTTVIDAVAAALPLTEQILFGPFSPKGIGTNGVDYRDPVLVAMDADLAQIARARGLRFISPIQEGWITGNPEAPGFGNADIYIGPDKTHLSAAGHEYIGLRAAGSVSVFYLPAAA